MLQRPAVWTRIKKQIHAPPHIAAKPQYMRKRQPPNQWVRIVSQYLARDGDAPVHSHSGRRSSEHQPMSRSVSNLRSRRSATGSSAIAPGPSMTAKHQVVAGSSSESHRSRPMSARSVSWLSHPGRASGVRLAVWHTDQIDSAWSGCPRVVGAAARPGQPQASQRSRLAHSTPSNGI